ncbi:transcriptional regulator domain-containing protein [uncultured Cohaesibacter sp.]|uniref:transcriptional regulator domain-containing protein n=1 Tax=uncultured Cohaesibacter sp. TaxID=1002546 RepID=UPI0029C6FD12|nr:DUF6499 domain-containing protein [uncultured Cohaesibacter sp.]
MQDLDWRSPGAYQYTTRLDAAGFAWEYLRRNDAYRRDWQLHTEAPVSKDSQNAFPEHWGVLFPARPGHFIGQATSVLVSAHAAAIRGACACAS